MQCVWGGRERRCVVRIAKAQELSWTAQKLQINVPTQFNLRAIAHLRRAGDVLFRQHLQPHVVQRAQRYGAYGLEAAIQRDTGQTYERGAASRHAGTRHRRYTDARSGAGDRGGDVLAHGFSSDVSCEQVRDDH